LNICQIEIQSLSHPILLPIEICMYDTPFIRITPENPVLWTGMKGVSAKGR